MNIKSSNSAGNGNGNIHSDERGNQTINFLLQNADVCLNVIMAKISLWPTIKFEY